MILVKPSFEIEQIPDNALSLIEKAGRTCYKSEQAITEDSARKFVEARIQQGHESVIEHAFMSVRFVCDRGVTHELVRHRLCAFSQESTRYCDYKGGVTFVIPPWVRIHPGEYPVEWSGLHGTCPELDSAVAKDDLWWFWHIALAERDYKKLLYHSWTPQEARAVLPNSLKTEIVMTANLREWRHIFRLRTSKAAHPQMREIMIPLLETARQRIPVIFNDIRTDDGI